MKSGPNTTMTWFGLATIVVLAAGAGCLGGEQPPADAAGASGPATTAGFSHTHVFPGSYDANGSRSQPLEAGPYEESISEVHQLESRVDDTVIEVEVVRPVVPDEVEVPVITVASPHYAGSPGGDNGLRDYERAARFVETFVPHGYAVAMHPVRGTDGDGACAKPLDPEGAEELDQLATWLGTRDWSNGNVSFVGLSSDGTAAWLAASTGNPHVKTVVPAAARNDLYVAMFRNGTWGSTSLTPAMATPYSLASEAGPENDRTRAPEAMACPRYAQALTETVHAVATGRPGPTGFWADHSARKGVQEAYEGSVFAVHGFGDESVNARNLYPWIASLPEHGIPVKQLYGWWGHDMPDEADDPDVPEHVRWDFAEMLLRWFDHWLKGDTVRDLGPRVQVEDSRGAWRSHDAWPPEHASEERWFLTPEGELSTESTEGEDSTTIVPKPMATSEAVTGASPPRSAAGCTCALFASPPLEEPLRFAGTPRVEVSVTPLSATGYVTVHLEDLGDEASTRITGGQASLDAAMPGGPVTQSIPLDPVDVLVPEGHRLVLAVSQSSHEGFTGNPGPFQVHLGNGQSTLALETFEVTEEAFFDPPG